MSASKYHPTRQTHDQRAEIDARQIARQSFIDAALDFDPDLVDWSAEPLTIVQLVEQAATHADLNWRDYLDSEVSR